MSWENVTHPVPILKQIVSKAVQTAEEVPPAITMEAEANKVVVESTAEFINSLIGDDVFWEAVDCRKRQNGTTPVVHHLEDDSAQFSGE